MRKKIILAFFCTLFFSLAGANPCRAEIKSEYLLRTLDLIAEKTFQGYNSEDYLQFFQYYSNTLTDVKNNRQYFTNVFMDVYKNNFGTILTRRIDRQASNLNPQYPRLVYTAECKKASDVLIVVNFQEESGTYRITQIKFDSSDSH